MKDISVVDLKLVSFLSHLNSFDLVSPEYEYLVNPVLHDIGMDLDYPLHYTVSKHRTLQNTVVVDYVIRGEVRCDRQFLTSSWATVIDKMVAAEYTDKSLCIDMLRMMSSSLNYNSFNNEPDYDMLDKFPVELKEPDEKEVLANIKQLEDILFTLRGSPYAEDGGLKMPQGWVDEKPFEQRKRRKEKIVLKKMKKEYE